MRLDFCGYLLNGDKPRLRLLDGDQCIRALLEDAGRARIEWRNLSSNIRDNTLCSGCPPAIPEYPMVLSMYEILES